MLRFRCDDVGDLQDAYIILIKSQGLSEWLYVIHKCAVRLVASKVRFKILPSLIQEVLHRYTT